MEEELEDICGSSDVSFTEFREKILAGDADTEDVYNDHPILHLICMYDFVTLEMVKYVLDMFPGMASWKTDFFFDWDSWEGEGVEIKSHALHCACYNEHCPSSVIELLLKEFVSASNFLSKLYIGVHECSKGLPLHYYLARYSNVDIDTLKLLVDAYPQSLVTSDEKYVCYPIHAAVYQSDLKNLHEILVYLLELEPSSIRMLDSIDTTPLNLACQNRKVNLEIVQLLYNSWPDALRLGDIDGCLPIHSFCCHNYEKVPLDCLRFFLSIDLTLVRERDRNSNLPIHLAVRSSKSTEFCKVLIDAFPESLRVRSARYLPIHEACAGGYRYGDRVDTVDTIQYMLKINPEIINVRDTNGMLPIHLAAETGRNNTILLLLKHDPSAASKRTEDENKRLPLHLAAEYGHLEAIKVLYDAYPEAVFIHDRDGETPSQLARQSQSVFSRFVLAYFQTQHEYTRRAQDMVFTMTPDKNGWLPLHRSLKDDVSLGTIKLLVKGGPVAVWTADKKLAFPLHIACEFCSVKVVRYLVGESNEHILGHLDANNDSVLHYACRGGNLDVVKYLLDEYASLVASVEANKAGELPLHLLCEAGKDKVDIDSVEYVETIWLMLLANPEGFR